MIHRTNARFWKLYRQLPAEVRDVADKNFKLLRENPKHPSLQFKKIGRLWSARIGIGYRVVGLDKEDTILWFWIGPHDEYKRMLGKR